MMSKGGNVRGRGGGAMMSEGVYNYGDVADIRQIRTANNTDLACIGVWTGSSICRLQPVLVAAAGKS